MKTTIDIRDIEEKLENDEIYFEPSGMKDGDFSHYRITLLPWDDSGKLSFKMKKFLFPKKRNHPIYGMQEVLMPVIPIMVDGEFFLMRANKRTFESICNFIVDNDNVLVAGEDNQCHDLHLTFDAYDHGYNSWTWRPYLKLKKVSPTYSWGKKMSKIISKLLISKES